MKYLRILLVCLMLSNVEPIIVQKSEAAFSETYIDLLGTNINSGTTASATPVYKCDLGNWDGNTVYTPVDGSTPASTISAGMFASVYTNAVNTNFVYGVRISSVAAGVNGAITLAGSAVLGTKPGVLAGTMAIRVGGAWSGPYATVKHPFTTANLNRYTNTSSDIVRVNWRGGTNYIMTNAISHSVTGPVRWEAYTNTPGDGGRAFWDGNAAIASWAVLTVTGAGNDFYNFDFSSNGVSGSADGPVFSTGNIIRCRANNMRGHGITVNGFNVVNECGSYSNNVSNTAGRGGFYASAVSTFNNCWSTNNQGNNTVGFYFDTAGISFNNCISTLNGKDGFGGNSQVIWMNSCDAYSNAFSGINLTGGTINGTLMVRNSNFLRNGAYAINNSGTRLKVGQMINCIVGSGTMTNVLGTFNDAGGVEIVNLTTLGSGVTPWVLPDSGDFRINVASAIGTGRGLFLNMPTVGYPDIGAAPFQGVTNSSASSSVTFQ